MASVLCTGACVRVRQDLEENKNLKAEISSLELRRFVGGMTRACSAFVAQFLDSALKMF